MAQRLKTDWILFFTVLAMVFSGVLIVYSASAIMAQMGPQPLRLVLRAAPGRVGRNRAHHHDGPEEHALPQAAEPGGRA